MSGRPEIITQRRINELVRSGIFWSLLWLGGIGSVIALMRGFEVRRLLRLADHPMKGGGGAWWCIVVGAIGVMLWLPLWIMGASHWR